MISNEAVRRLIACDRETLVALMAAAYADGSFHLSRWEFAQDADVLALLDAAKVANHIPSTVTDGEAWMHRRVP
jgi:hypothetical protein